MSAFFAILKIYSFIAAGGGIALALGVLAFFLWPSRTSLIAAGCAIGVLMGVAGYSKGALDEKAVCVAREARAEAAARQRDIDMAAAAQADEATRTAELDAARQQDMEKLNAYEKELASRKAPACRITPDDLR